MKQGFRAVVFDLDGTLADTLATIAHVANGALRDLGLAEHPIEAYKRFVGDGVATLARRVLPEGAGARHEELLARIRARYASRFLDHARLYDGIAELLLELARRGAQLGMLSNKPDLLTLQTAAGLGIAPRFGAIRGQREGVAPKPDPVAALEVARALDVAPAEVLYVGDTATDMQTARNAGFAPLGVLWGFRDRAELEAAGARWLAAHPRDVLERFEAGP